MSEYYSKYAIGESIPDFIGQPDGQRITTGNDGLMLYAYVKDPTPMEIEQFGSDSRIFMNAIGLESEVVMFTFKVGELPWFEAPYNPRLDPNYRKASDEETGDPEWEMPLTMFLINTTDGKLLEMRLLKIPHELSAIILEFMEDVNIYGRYNRNQYINALALMSTQYSAKDYAEESGEPVRIQ